MTEVSKEGQQNTMDSRSHGNLRYHLSDAPAKNDLLQYIDYQNVICALIQQLDAERKATRDDEPSDGTALTIGIFGSWGIGKTTLLKLVQNELTDQGTESIWVNVWKLGNEEDIWAAFLQALLLRIKKKMPWYRRIL